jgi:polyhydroxyalkanoate synthesis regulator phasin
MQKRTASIILASTLAVGGGAVAFTPASAADSDNPVKSRLAEFKSSLSGLVKDGTLTQDQADKVAKTLDEKLPKGGPGHGGPGGRGEDLAAAAKALGLTEAELRTKLEDGKSLADIAKAQDVSVDTLIKALVAAAEDRIDAAVKAGKLTEAQATERKKNLTQRITDRVNNVRPERPEGDAGRPPAPPASDS